MNLLMNEELSYQIYSEFKNSNWYIYWDKEYAYIKDYQLLVVWHIKAEHCVNYDYSKLKPLLAEGKAQFGLPYHSLLTDEERREFLAICEEFIMDMDAEFGK